MPNNPTHGVDDPMTRFSPVSLRQMLFLAAFSITACPAFADDAATSAGAAAVATLGRLNGTALACSQPALTARIREIVVAVAPKERGIGEVFEQATSAAFLAQGQQNPPCPEGKALAAQVDSAEAALKQAYPKVP